MDTNNLDKKPDIGRYLIIKNITCIILFATIFNKLALAQSVTLPTQTELPLQFNTGNEPPYGLPSTIITIQGKDIPIILDTGASKSKDISLSEYALNNIHVRFTGKVICFKTVQGNLCQKEFIVPELRIGSFILKNVKGTLMRKLWGYDKGFDEGFRATESLRNGIIGLPLLSKFNVVIDYPDSKLVLIKKSHKPFNYDIKNWIPIKFEGPLQTHLNIDGKSLILRWDTGATPSVIKSSVIKNYKKQSCQIEPPYILDNCSSIVTKSFTTNEGSKLPRTWFKIMNIPSYAPFDGLIGSNFFRENLVYCDFNDHYIYVKHR